MRHYVLNVVILFACLSFLPSISTAHASDVTLYVSVSPTTVVAGEWASVSGVVVNNTAAKVRLTVTFQAVDTCGTKTDLGYNRLALEPGQSVLVTTAYATKAASCRGTHVITFSTGGKGGSTAISAAANLEVT
jgi:hypothetical protein